MEKDPVVGAHLGSGDASQTNKQFGAKPSPAPTTCQQEEQDPRAASAQGHTAVLRDRGTAPTGRSCSLQRGLGQQGVHSRLRHQAAVTRLRQVSEGWAARGENTHHTHTHTHSTYTTRAHASNQPEDLHREPCQVWCQLLKTTRTHSPPSATLKGTLKLKQPEKWITVFKL